jgi:prophage maintenance system killer protein
LTYYLEFGDYCRIAAEVLGVEPERVAALPDGNKRAAFLSMERFLAANGHPLVDADPDTDVPIVEKIAAGDARPAEVARWLEARIA